mmetsp:Transcript_27535/g.44028  ORF Transcript_27535/g.44028 Transcript_27535/m.44028 type:complete len:92 (+) Transcript_27535:1530-1805(+)
MRCHRAGRTMRCRRAALHYAMLRVEGGRRLNLTLLETRCRMHVHVAAAPAELRVAVVFSNVVYTVNRRPAERQASSVNARSHTCNISHRKT